MKLSVEEISSVEKKLTVTVDKDDVSKEYLAILANVRQNAGLKGFRKGKAPISVVESTYGPKIREDLVTKLIEDTYRKALEEKELNPVSQPSITIDQPYKKGEDFAYNIIIELMPEFEVSEYAGFSLKTTKTDVTAADVDDTLQKIQEQNAVFNETEDGKAIATDDMAIIDFKGTLSDGS
ncbi:trigger factor, partial [Thermodesulfobacteriota bacterium]